MEGSISIYVHDNVGSGGGNNLDKTSYSGNNWYNHTYISNTLSVKAHSGNSGSNDSAAAETRPINYTFVIWKRIN